MLMNLFRKVVDFYYRHKDTINALVVEVVACTLIIVAERLLI